MDLWGYEDELEWILQLTFSESFWNLLVVLA